MNLKFNKQRIFKVKISILHKSSLRFFENKNISSAYRFIYGLYDGAFSFYASVKVLRPSHENITRNSAHSVTEGISCIRVHITRFLT